MAPWGDSKLFFSCCVLFVACYCTVTLAQIPMDCCLTVKDKEVNKRLIVDYSQQTQGRGCSIDATVLVTRMGRTLCVPADRPWIEKVRKHVDHCKKNPKDRHCARAQNV